MQNDSNKWHPNEQAETCWLKNSTQMQRVEFVLSLRCQHVGSTLTTCLMVRLFQSGNCIIIMTLLLLQIMINNYMYDDDDD